MPQMQNKLLVLAASLPLASPALASKPDQTSVEAALISFMDDFNAVRTDSVCTIFAQDLRYDYIGFRERDHDELCNGLKRSLNDPQRRYHYDLEIKEILVSGDLAVARVVWTLTATRKSAGSMPPTISYEHSMDIFRRQGDGRWKLIRFNAYADP